MSTRSKTFSYDVALEWEGDRRSTLAAGPRPAILSGPPEDFPHGEQERWSPEHLFLGALSSCTLLSFLAHCAHRHVEVRSYSAVASGTIERRAQDGRYAFVAVHLRPEVVVASGQVGDAHELTAKAERDCFVSASTTATVDVEWVITEG